MNRTRRSVLAWGAGGCVAGALASVRAVAGEWNGRPVRIVVVYPPGGLSDTIARLLALGMAERLGVPVIVENHPGNGGSVGMQLLARSQPDGHTLAFSAVTPLTLKPHLERVPYDPLRDFLPVAAVMSTPVLLVATPSFSGRDFDDVLAQARARPGELRWATSGVATSGHLVLAQVCLGAGVSITHVPYKGGGQQLHDALNGEFELLSTNLAPEQLRFVEQSRLRPLAVGAPARVPVLPEVRTFAELGLPGANVSSLFGLFAPAGTPPGLVARVNAVVAGLLAQPAMQERLLGADNIPGEGSSADFAKLIEMQWASNRQLAPAMLQPRS